MSLFIITAVSRLTTTEHFYFDVELIYIFFLRTPELNEFQLVLDSITLIFNIYFICLRQTAILQVNRTYYSLHFEQYDYYDVGCTREIKLSIITYY